jgi:hypothetical protein
MGIGWNVAVNGCFALENGHFPDRCLTAASCQKVPFGTPTGFALPNRKFTIGTR